MIRPGCKPETGTAESVAAQSLEYVYLVIRWLYIEEGEGFDIEGVFASEEAAQAFIDREPIPGNRYKIKREVIRG